MNLRPRKQKYKSFGAGKYCPFFFINIFAVILLGFHSKIFYKKIVYQCFVFTIMFSCLPIS